MFRLLSSVANSRHGRVLTTVTSVASIHIDQPVQSLLPLPQEQQYKRKIHPKASSPKAYAENRIEESGSRFYWLHWIPVLGWVLKKVDLNLFEKDWEKGGWVESWSTHEGDRCVHYRALVRGDGRVFDEPHRSYSIPVRQCANTWKHGRIVDGYLEVLPTVTLDEAMATLRRRREVALPQEQDPHAM